MDPRRMVRIYIACPIAGFALIGGLCLLDRWPAPVRFALAMGLYLPLLWVLVMALRVRSRVHGTLASTDIDSLARALNDGEDVVREAAVAALGNTGDPRAVAPLIEALTRADPSTHRAVVEALAKLGLPAVDALLSALKDEDYLVRLGAVRALGRIGDTCAVEPLVQVLDERGHAAPADAVAMLKEAKQRALQALICMLDDEEWMVANEAAHALAEVEAAVEALLRTGLGESARMRRHAAQTLGNLGDTRAASLLLQGVLDPDQHVRAEAAIALGRLGGPTGRGSPHPRSGEPPLVDAGCRRDSPRSLRGRRRPRHPRPARAGQGRAYRCPRRPDHREGRATRPSGAAGRIAARRPRHGTGGRVGARGPWQ